MNRKGFVLLLLFANLVAVNCAFPQWTAAGLLKTGWTFPGFEAGIDSCVAGNVIPETDLLTAVRTFNGPQSGSDSLVARLPGTRDSLSQQVRSGVYTVSLRLHDQAFNWSCVVTIPQVVRGRVSPATNVGFLLYPTLDRVFARLERATLLVTGP